MGQVTSVLQTQEPVADVLDRLESNIKELERDIRNKKKTFQRFNIVTAIFIAGLLIWYLSTIYNWKWNKELLFTIPLIAVPVLFLYLLRYVVSECYSWRLEKSKSKLNEIRLQKRKELDEVKNTRNYKEAKVLLDKYEDPNDEMQPLIL